MFLACVGQVLGCGMPGQHHNDASNSADKKQDDDDDADLRERMHVRVHLYECVRA